MKSHTHKATVDYHQTLMTFSLKVPTHIKRHDVALTFHALPIPTQPYKENLAKVANPKQMLHPRNTILS